MDRRMRWWAALLLLLVCGAAASEAQVLETPGNSTCQGVLMHYQLQSVTMIPPFVGGAQQPYRFQSSLTLNNMGFEEVKNWQVYIGFQHGEWLVGAPGTVLADGEQLPVPVGNGTTLSGFPQTDMLNSVETAGDMTKTTVIINITGTEFGVNASDWPLPRNISLPVDGYTCGSITKLGNDTLQLCCRENATAVNLTSVEPFLAPEKGDITITYSVTQTFKDNYAADVEISNDNPLGRLDGWNLTWEWKQGEFILQMWGAQALEQDQSECLNGPAGTFYLDFDFSTVSSCKKTPTIVDLGIEKTNDTKVGLVPFCCRSGLLLPRVMDPSKAKSVFKLNVKKVPPHLDRDDLNPPANFKIGPTYSCGQPRLIAPVESPDPSSPTRSLSAVKSWQVTCNLTGVAGAAAAASTPAASIRQQDLQATSCCVSFSAFYNDSAVPCPTCACGCPSSSSSCDSEAEAMLVPPYGLLTAAAERNRTALEWARINRLRLPKRLPCSDTCGVNINWHVVSDFKDGWSARISLLNWGQTVPDWFAAVEMDEAMPGFKQLFTLNGSLLLDATWGGHNNRSLSRNATSWLYMQGRQGFSDYLLQRQNGSDKPSSMQAVITFDKRATPGITVTGGHGFPTRVVFNGQQCALPTTLPATSAAPPRFPTTTIPLLLLLLLSLLLLQQH